MVEGRRGRRPGRALLPLRRVSDVVDVDVNLSNTVSCWYCDWKTSYLNKPLFNFGHRHSRFLKLWFSVGMGFGLTTLLGISLILILELAKALHRYNGNLQFSRVLSGSFFGVYSSVLGVRISVAAVGYMCISTVISVCAHEFGHALAAASEGVQMEYSAVFWAVLFPGALIAFSDELLQELPRFSALRIYCAGIWHNATLCIFCALTLFLLPFILYPFYIHGESPMVMDVSSDSPLSTYLSPGDLVVSLDGNRIHSAEEWTEMTRILSDQTLRKAQYNSGRKGYCIPDSLIGESTMQVIDNQPTCENELLLFTNVSCAGSSLLNDSGGEDDHEKGRENVYCVTPKNVLNLQRCGEGWVNATKDESSCSCSEGSCLTPVKLPGLTWVEIAYSSLYSPECRKLRRESISSDKSLDTEESSCGGTFIFIGDLISMANSVLVTSYQPRWPFFFGAYIPCLLEKLLMYTFHVSLMLALLNGLPVYHLDGESILETSLCCLGLLTPRQRDIILRLCLLGGTLVSVILVARIFLVAVVS